MASYAHRGLTITPLLAHSFGAEVAGIDWSQPALPPETVQILKGLQDQYAVLVFRGTGLDNARHVRFASQLGRLDANPAWGGTQRVGSPYLFDVSNIEADGSIVKKGTRRWAHALGNALWHTDSSFNQHRAKYSLLLSHRVPDTADSVQTDFADTRQAWKDLPASRKNELRELVVEHELWHSRRLSAPEHYATLTDEERGQKPPAYHQLVQVAPNGDETLYLAAHAKRLFTADGSVVPDSQRVIWDLIHHCTQPKYTVSVPWNAAGDMVWWDNRQSMHRARPYDESMGPRDVRRATVLDDEGAYCGLSPEAIQKLHLQDDPTI